MKRFQALQVTLAARSQHSGALPPKTDTETGKQGPCRSRPGFTGDALGSGSWPFVASSQPRKGRAGPIGIPMKV